MPYFTTSDGCSIDYTLHAALQDQAPRVALIHSLALDRSVWDGVVRELAGAVHVLAYDCRGHGKSAKPAGAYTAELYARDLAELFNHIGWPSAAVAGCSMGGAVAQAFGGLFPQRVTALGLIDTTAWYGAEAPRQFRERAAKAKAEGLESMVDFQTSRWFSDKFRAEHADLVQTAASVFLANDLDAYASACILLGDADLRPYLSALKMPVAVIAGEEDYAAPVAMGRQIHEAVAGSTFTILPGARHLTPIECPGVIASEVRALVTRAAAA